MGPVDGEVAAIYWFADGESSDGGEDADGPGLRAEVWFFKHFGISGEMFQLDVGSDGDIDLTNLDVKWRPFSPTENSFFALGSGWQKIELEGVDTSGFRIVAEGRVGLAGFAYVYGRAAYFPSLDDLEVGGMTLGTDVDGSEYDLGVAFEPAPFLSVWAGYRRTKMNFTFYEGGADKLQLDGFYAGAGIHF
jgi:hypothetical protein